MQTNTEVVIFKNNNSSINKKSMFECDDKRHLTMFLIITKVKHLVFRTMNIIAYLICTDCKLFIRLNVYINTWSKSPLAST